MRNLNRNENLKQIIFDEGIYKRIYWILYLFIFTVITILFLLNVLNSNFKPLITREIIYLLLIIVGLMILPVFMSNIKEISIGNTNLKFRELENQVEEYKNQMEKIIAFTLGEHIFRKLLTIHNKEYQKLLYDKKDKALNHEIQILQDQGFLHLDPLLSSLSDGDDLADKMCLTDIGYMYVNFRLSEATKAFLRYKN